VNHRVGVAIFATCAAMMITGCGALAPRDAQTSSTPRPSVTGNTAASPSTKVASPTTSATQATPRPWKVTLKRTDSCRIVEAIPPEQFGSSYGKVDSSDAINFPGNLGCSRLSGGGRAGEDQGIILNVTAVVDQGMDEVVSSPNVEELIDQRLTVRGFRAVVVKSPPTGVTCNGFLDVADGQFVHVWLGQPYGSSDRVVVPTAKLCDTVPRVLDAVVEVLESSRSTSN
jgi:hypothetical protein